MKLKRISAFLFSIILVVSLFPSSMAASNPSETVIDLGDGFYVVEALEISPSPYASDTVYGTKRINFYYLETLIGTTTLGGAFDISGSTAKATSGNIVGTGSNGWTYQSGTTSYSGNTVYGTATYKSSDGTTKSHTGSISCSPSGTLS